MPADHDAQLTYAVQLADAGKLDEGIKLAQKQLTGAPDDREVYFDLAEMDVRAKRWKDASHAFDQAAALAIKPDDKVILYYYRGDAALREKLYDEAELDFRRGLAIDPDNASIENDLGYMYADRGIKLDDAVTMLKKAVASDPQNYAFLDSLAWAYYKQGQYADGRGLRAQGGAADEQRSDAAGPPGRDRSEERQAAAGDRGLEQVAAGVCELAGTGCRSSGRGAGAA